MGHMGTWTTAAKLLAGSWVVFGAVVIVGAACNAAGGRAAGSGGGSSGGGGHASSDSAGSTSTGIVGEARADESGSRLKVNVIVGDDGSKHYLGSFHDPQIDTDCQFRAVAGGSQRCVPLYAASVVYYADDACTVPLVQPASVCGSPEMTHAIVTDAVGCVSEVHEIGQSFTGQLYVGSPSACSSTISASTPNVIFRLGADVPLSTFVGGKPSTE